MKDDGDDWLDEAQVMSEVHIGSDVGLRNTVSVFSISRPLPASAVSGTQSGQGITEMYGDLERGDAIASSEGVAGLLVETDEHGDLVLPRRKRRAERDECQGDVVMVHHHLTTRLREVGLQVWKGSLLLSDFILHMMLTTNEFKDTVAMELGAGTGLAGLIMARAASLVFITDKGTDILDNCTRNVFLNLRSYSNGEESVRVRELDWLEPWPPTDTCEEKHHNLCHSPYNWTSQDMKDAEKISVLLAADVVYSPDITNAFFAMLKKLMPVNSGKVLYLALEKRYNFSMTDLNVVAHGHKHFLTFFDLDHPLEGEYCSHEKAIREEEDAIDSNCVRHQFWGRELVISRIPQYVTQYDRGKDLELWEIRPYDA